MRGKVILLVLLSSIMGIVVGSIVFNKNNSVPVFKESNTNIYYLQYGVYSNSVVMEYNTRVLDNYVYEVIGSKYYVYVLVSTSYENAFKVRNMYKDRGIELYIKEGNIDNGEFLSLLSQYDVLLSDADNFSDIVGISNVIMTDFLELVVKRVK